MVLVTCGNNVVKTCYHMEFIPCDIMLVNMLLIFFDNMVLIPFDNMFVRACGHIIFVTCDNKLVVHMSWYVSTHILSCDICDK